MKTSTNNNCQTTLSSPSTFDINNISTAIDALNCIAEIGDIVSNTIKTCQEEETKREAIRTNRDIQIEKIHQKCDLIRSYLDRTFDERARIFDKQFEVLDEALRTRDLKMLEMTLTHIHTLAAQSPFKNLSDFEQTQKALLDKENTIWDI